MAEVQYLDKFISDVTVNWPIFKFKTTTFLDGATYRERLQMAQMLAGAVKKSTNGEGTMKLIDIMGNEVGGIGITGVWVVEK